MDRVLQASEYGDVAKKFIESGNCVTPTIVVSAISRKLQKEIEFGDETVEGRLKRLEFISAISQVVDLDFDVVVTACKTDLEMKKGERFGVSMAKIVFQVGGKESRKSKLSLQT